MSDPQRNDPPPSDPAASAARDAQDFGFAGHPAGLSTLFFAELWERFSYYGMRALLALFIVAPAAAGGMGLSTVEAARIYGNYTMAVYMLSIPGGYIADHYLGARRAVLIGGTLIACGHFTLALHSQIALLRGAGAGGARDRPLQAQHQRHGRRPLRARATSAATPASRSSTWASISAASSHRS